MPYDFSKVVPATTTKLLSKLSIATIGGAGVMAKQAAQAVDQAIIFGRAMGTKDVVVKETGEVFEAIVGEFEARNVCVDSRKEVRYQSGVLYLPAGLHDTLSAAAKKVEQEGSGRTVDFAVLVTAVPSTNKAGYTYEGEPLIAPAEADPMAGLRSQMGLPEAKQPVAALPSAAPLPEEGKQLAAEELEATRVAAPKGKGGK